MPRKKQQNPQPVKSDSKDVVAAETLGNLTLDADFLLEHDLHFADPYRDHKFLGLEKFSEVAAEIGFSVFPLCDEDNPDCSQLSMDSETENSHSSTPDNVREDEGRMGRSEPAFPPYLSCRGCGQLRDDPLGHLVGPYCLRCCKAARDVKTTDFAYGSLSGIHPHAQLDGIPNGTADGALPGDDKAKLHSCHQCGFSSRYANHVKRHMKTHNGEKPFNCPICAYASAQLVNLQRHLRIHTGEKPYKCESCAFACSSLGNLKRHQRMHAPNTGVPGGQDASLRPGSGPSGPKSHMTGQRTSEEEEEDEAAKEVAAASAHLSLAVQNADYLSVLESLKGASPQPTPSSAPAPGGRSGRGGGAALSSSLPYTCRLCAVVLEDEDGSSAQICAKCTLEMLTKDSSSSPGSPVERTDKVYTCAACPFLTHYPNHLARHMKTHSGEKPYKCPQCDYATAHFDNLKRHHRVHTGEKPYKCHLCDYACGNLANLKRHQRVHSGAKPFQCAICNYSCNQSMNLKRHMLRHTGEKPYKCQECGYTTGHWDNYKRHQKKHGLATDGWVKVPMTGGRDQDDVAKGTRGGVGAAAHMAREGAQTLQHSCYKLEMV
ncbi:zinc finger protein 513a [Dunckerocampus dactyliophorus]|uniref:zinc finger protein 513a n=1 Tax=Dunckerocampus dactyliophorus TaxID=161453 RepID=UPI002404D45F|nr:zinc finger protein 513a [Dunckerocampus dactyliophorus]